MASPRAIFGAFAFVLLVAALAPQRLAAAATATEPPDQWPKSAEQGGATYSIYPPQVDAWDNGNVTAHATVSVRAQGAKEPVFGAITLGGGARVDRAARTVYFIEPAIRGANFTTAANQAARYRETLQSLFDKGSFTLPLDRVEAALVQAGGDSKARLVAVQNPVPQFVFSANSAVLVTIDGDPVWRPVAGTAYQRVINTRSLLLRDAAGAVYLHLFDGFLKAPGLTGPWTTAAKVPRAMRKAAKKLAKAGAVDLMEKPPVPKEAPRAPKKSRKAAKKKPPALAVIVATRPTELIVTDGDPEWARIDGTELLYIENTDANVLTDMGNRQTYLLVSGRWFTAPGLDGPWRYVAGKDLPATFAQMHDDSPKENVKASIPGTAQAKEALIASLMPQTAIVDRAKARFAPSIAGAPEIKPVAGAQLNYVVNSPTPLVQAPNGPWFALQDGVWFTAPALPGPWAVASMVPAAIYTLPVSSPLYYATYVHIYDSSPTTVTVGYLPGYLGVYASTGGTIVYGTGYAYKSYLGSTEWYGAPVTYGYAAGLAWTPWTGWGFGFGMGWEYGPAWGLGIWGWSSAPYWGAYGGGGAWDAKGGFGDWGPQGWAATSGNVYHQWHKTGAVTRTSAGYSAWTGNTWSAQVGHSYNSRTGEVSASQGGNIDNVYADTWANAPKLKQSRWRAFLAAARARVTIGGARASQPDGAHPGEQGAGDATSAAAEDSHYADVNGTVYRNTGKGWQKQNKGGGWSSAGADSVRMLDAQQQAQDWGEMRASASSWGGGGRGYGGSFRGSGDGLEGGGFRSSGSR